MQRLDVGGLSFWVREDSSDQKAIAEVVTRNGYRRRDFQFHQGEDWLDLGANVGAFSVLAASEGASVIAVEPEPETVAILKRNISLNGLVSKVEVVEGAATPSERGVGMLHVNSASRNFWRSSLEKPWRGGRRVPVRLVPLVDLLREDQHCKMDIEGSEMPLLESIESKLWKRLVFEWSFDVDGSIPRFAAQRDKLRAMYDNVVYPKFDESHESWPKSWFPACRTVWCY